MSYSGETQRRVLDPAGLGTGDEAPPGQHRLGQVSATCVLADARGGLDGARLSDVGCSTALLRAALRERAAAAGATYLVDSECDPGGALDPGDRAQCSAEAWGPRDPKQALAQPDALPVNADPQGSAAPFAPAFGSVADAWRVRVDYWPAAGQAEREPVAPEQVGEIDFPRVGYARLGDVRARADKSCAPDSVRGALRAAAARAGATSVVGVRCIDEDGEQVCIASVAALAVAEPVAEAR